MPREAAVEPIRIAIMKSEAAVIKEDQRGLVVTGTLMTHGAEEVSAYVKVPQHDPYRLVVELVCAALAKALGLQVPSPYLVVVHPQALPAKNLSEPTWGFGSETVYPNISAPLSGRDADTLKRIQAWSQFTVLCAFDEWIANNDRTPENLLFDGKDFRPIDHGEAIPQGQSPKHRAPGGNWQLDRHVPDLSEFERRMALGNIGKPLRDMGAAPVWSLHHFAHFPALDGGEATADGVQRFLLERMGHMEVLLREALHLPRPVDEKLI